jgi:hypothetical protein
LLRPLYDYQACFIVVIGGLGIGYPEFLLATSTKLRKGNIHESGYLLLELGGHVVLQAQQSACPQDRDAPNPDPVIQAKDQYPLAPVQY